MKNKLLNSDYDMPPGHITDRYRPNKPRIYERYEDPRIFIWPGEQKINRLEKIIIQLLRPIACLCSYFIILTFLEYFKISSPPHTEYFIGFVSGMVTVIIALFWIR